MPVNLDLKIDNSIDVTSAEVYTNDLYKEEQKDNKLSEEEQALVNNYRMLNADGQEDLLDYSAYNTTKARFKLMSSFFS